MSGAAVSGAVFAASGTAVSGAVVSGCGAAVPQATANSRTSINVVNENALDFLSHWFAMV